METEKALTSRKLRALETKKMIFEAAKTLFAEKGYENVSIDDITTRAGTSKGTFYIYFKNKEHIILEQFKLIDKVYLNTAKNLAKELSARDKLLAFVKAQQEYVSESFGLNLLKVVYYSQLTPDKEKIALVDEKRVLYVIVRKVVRQGQQTGEFRKDVSCREITNWITFWMRSMLYDWCVQDGQYNVVERGQVLFAMLIEGMLSAKTTVSFGLKSK